MILAILQARVSSSRLPGKVLKPILGQPMLARQIERISRSKNIDELIVATSVEATDDAVEDLCSKVGVGCFRGSLNDVLDRFYQAANLYDAEHVVRLTGDCPLTDPELIDKVITFHLENGFDYTSNTLQLTFPNGLDSEIMRRHVLQQVWEEAKQAVEREHVTYSIYNQPQRFRLGGVKNTCDLSSLRWTVDEPEDYEFVKQVYEALYTQKVDFTTEDILGLLTVRPELVALNAKYQRNEGLNRSLERQKKEERE